MENKQTSQKVKILDRSRAHITFCARSKNTQHGFILVCLFPREYDHDRKSAEWPVITYQFSGFVIWTSRKIVMSIWISSILVPISRDPIKKRHHPLTEAICSTFHQFSMVLGDYLRISNWRWRTEILSRQKIRKKKWLLKKVEGWELRVTICWKTGLCFEKEFSFVHLSNYWYFNKKVYWIMSGVIYSLLLTRYDHFVNRNK